MGNIRLGRNSIKSNVQNLVEIFSTYIRMASNDIESNVRVVLIILLNLYNICFVVIKPCMKMLVCC